MKDIEQRLTALYNKAGEKKSAAMTQFQRAKKACKAMEDVKAAEDAAQAAEQAFSASVSDAEAALDAARSALRAEVEENVRVRSLVNPADVVDPALTLLNSGIMTSADLMAMADRYHDNPTMLRLIMPRARQAMHEASFARDSTERDALERVIERCQSHLNANLIAFDQLVEKLDGEQ